MILLGQGAEEAFAIALLRPNGVGTCFEVPDTDERDMSEPAPRRASKDSRELVVQASLQRSRLENVLHCKLRHS